MFNTEPLTQADIDTLNQAIRSASVRVRDVNALERLFGVNIGGETIQHWFDSTNGGDYHPCIPQAALGLSPWQLADRSNVQNWDLYMRVMLGMLLLSDARI